MDDIEMLHAARPQTEAPSRATSTAARAALMEHATSPRPRHRPVRRLLPSRFRLAGAAVLAAGVTAVAVVVATPTGPPTATLDRGRPSAAGLGHERPSASTPGGPSFQVRKSGRQILLAAATTAAATPEESGTYWYVRTAYTKTTPGGDTGKSTVETWTRRDGASWVRQSSKGKVIDNNGDAGHWSDGFDLEGTRLSYEQIQRLPTDPDELAKWLLQHATQALTPKAARTTTLIDVLSSMPAPPDVRAAAFRALAALPEVRSLGAVDGGEALSIKDSGGEIKLIVDPQAARLRGSSFAGDEGKASGTITVEAAEWTDDLPEAAG
ncbi:CU044_5270 family protein [Sphaerisporangium fuscum]|uniref:CU044_5270 family protein n=1 Tax=Sphaerisporangium fuscum TaxID=2835868 RepID=UPI001BDD0FBA|nr:CU044_5270 family protein [Sphaerisporangium fuscum]